MLRRMAVFLADTGWEEARDSFTLSGQRQCAPPGDLDLTRF
jgi:hypothetical protein